MADVYEQNLASKSTLTTTDYIRVVGSDNVSYKQLVSDVAKKIIENYTGSTLAGSAQSVKSAVDSLNSKKATGTYDFNGTSSGRGYVTVTMSASVANEAIKSIHAYTGAVSASGGLQLSPICTSGTTLYVNYYAPIAITGACLFTFDIY